MTDLEWIYVLLAVLYLAECGCWVRPGSLLLVGQLGGRCALRWPQRRALLRNAHGGLLLGNLLPLGRSHVVHAWPVALAPLGVVAPGLPPLDDAGTPPAEPRFFPWEEVLGLTREHRELRLGSHAVACASPPQAAYLGSLLKQIASLPADQRGPAIERALSAALDVHKLADILRTHQRYTIGLLLACSTLFLYLFVGCPLLRRHDLADDFLSFLPPYLVLLGLTFLALAAAHRALERPPAELWSALATMLVSPADALHARDRLLRPLAHAHHPVALAALVAPTPQFRELAQQTILDLCFPRGEIRRIETDQAAAVGQWFRARSLAALAEFLRDQGIDPHDLLRPPRPEQTECRSFCPRCRGQYVLEAGTCSTCQRPLHAFAAPAAPVPAVELPALAPPPAAPPPVPTAPAAPPSPGRRHQPRKRRK